MYAQGFFYIFAGISIFAALGVILSQHLVYSVLFLILTFVATAILWLLLKAECLALLLALIYIGAILVLFLFVIMVFDLNHMNKEKRLNHFMVLGVSISGLLMSLLIYVLKSAEVSIDNSRLIVEAVRPTDLVKIGTLLFTEHLVSLEIAGALLLTAIVAIIGLIANGVKR